MGVRTNLEIIFQIGRNNELTDLLFDESLTSLLDTLDHATTHEATLAAGQSNYVVPFGDVLQSQLVYILADGAIRVTPGGGAATSAIVTASGGSFPTGFSGGETLELDIDDIGSFVTTFDAADQALAAVINRINAAAALVPIVDGGGVPVTAARDNGSGQRRLLSSTTGIGSEVEVISGSVGVLAQLGLSVGVTNGVNAIAGQTPVTLTKPVNTAGTFSTAGVPVFFFASLQTGALTIDNLEAVETRLTVAIAGDLLTEPPSDC
jgi:hypothetical protein